MNTNPSAPINDTATPSSASICAQRLRFSASDVRRLETIVNDCVSTGDHCVDCHRIATFLRIDRKRSAFASRPQAAATADALLGMLTSFSDRLARREIPRDAAHNQLASVIAAFLRQGHANYINDATARNGYLIALLRSRK